MDAANTPYELHRADALEWISQRCEHSLHAVVTDPPYGLFEYEPEQLSKKKHGTGGVWRIPPAFDGRKRQPLPRFSVLGRPEQERMSAFFSLLARTLWRTLVPGAHVFCASNPLVSDRVATAFFEAGYEKRGQIVRIVRTLRGGDRPKNAHEEFREVTVMPKSCWEPWLLFRKPCEGRVQDNLRKWGTGGLRRISDEDPFRDLIECSPARGLERELAPHPSLKPQRLMRSLVRASLPLGEGVLLDPFMGSGSTVAAALSLGYTAIGLERDPEYFELARRAVPSLAATKCEALVEPASTGAARPDRSVRSQPRPRA